METSNQIIKMVSKASISKYYKMQNRLVIINARKRIDYNLTEKLNKKHKDEIS